MFSWGFSTSVSKIEFEKENIDLVCFESYIFVNCKLASPPCELADSDHTCYHLVFVLFTFIICIYKITSHNATTMPIMRHNWHCQCQLCDIQCRICCINGIVAQLALQLHNWHCGCTIGIVVAQLAL